MDLDEDPCERTRRLCEEHAIIPAARKRTRYWRTDLIDDTGVLQRLCTVVETREREAAQRSEPGLMAESDEVVAQALATDAARVLRDHLVTTLTGTYDLERIAADACDRAGIAGRESQIAYCLIVLCQKQDPSRVPSGGGAPRRTYELDLGADGFTHQLESWAERVARHLRDSSATYATIQEEAERYEIATLRKLIPIGRAHDDVADNLADDLSIVFTSGQRLEDMSIPAAVAVEPLPGAYVFQSPLSRWVRTTTNRVVPRDTDPLDPADERFAGRDGREDDERDSAHEDAYQALVAWLAGLLSTRDLLSSAIDLAERIDKQTAARTFDDDARYVRFRAELAHVIDELRREQRSFGAMLAYILLAMRPAAKRQRVAILSLRNDALDDHVIEHIAQRMRNLVNGDAPPIASLITKTERASRALVPARRVNELTLLRDDRRHRADAFTALAQMLDELPATVSDLAAIGAAVPPQMAPGTVSTTRGHAVDELEAVDELFARGFRRYAMRAA